MPRVALHTLGCKVNQYESQQIAKELSSRGFDLVDFSDRADVYIINTCTVTNTADSKSRQAARSAVHRNPQAAVVLTGCYAETSPEQARGIEGVAMVVGNREKSHLVEYVIGRFGRAFAGRVEETEIERRGAPSAHESEASTSRTRALLKIQDGCDQFCSYCAVPFARSVMSSRPCAEVLAEAQDLARRGFKEIVLTGIRLGTYADGETNLIGLLESLAGIRGIRRIRLSSIELTDIPDGLIELMAEHGNICRHLHIPLQSGDDGVLARMNRPYTAAQFASFVDKARSVIPGIAITTDVMVGFPGETEKEFESTCQLVERIRFARAHVFRYSSRPRTAAADMPDDVGAEDRERRSDRLTRLTSACAHEFASRLVGETVPVLVEGKRIDGKLRSGLTDNYVRVILEASQNLVGEIVDVKVESVERGTATGRIVV